MKKFANTKQIVLLFTLLLIGSFGAFAQKNPAASPTTTTLTLKTLRAVDPNNPVVVANEIFGGLHAVQTIAQLHGEVADGDGTDLALEDGNLQKGMLVYCVQTEMYYQYIGDDQTKGNNHTNVTTVDPTYWKPLTEFTKEKVTVVPDCTNAYDFPSTWLLDHDGDGAVTGSTPTDPLDFSAKNAPGDHLILMPDTGSEPIATYVWSEDANGSLAGTAPGWVLINVADLAQVVTQNADGNTDLDLSKDPDGNGYDHNNYNEGDILKLKKGNAYITYVLASDGNWKETGRGITTTSISYPVFKGNYKGQSNDNGTPSDPLDDYIEDVTDNIVSIGNFITKEDFLFQSNSSEGSGYAIVGEELGAVIEYPAFWGNFVYSINYNSGVYELTNGTLIEIINKTVDGETIKYKRVKIACGTKTIYLN